MPNADNMSNSATKTNTSTTETDCGESPDNHTTPAVVETVIGAERTPSRFCQMLIRAATEADVRSGRGTIPQLRQIGGAATEMPAHS